VLYQQNGDRIVTIDSVTSLRQRRKRPSYRAIYSSIMQGVPERVPNGIIGTARSDAEWQAAGRVRSECCAAISQCDYLK